MPRISRLFIKSGMVYLMLGVILALIADIPNFDTGIHLLPVYWHMIVIGWITQVIMGVSIWMFPGRTRRKTPVDSFYSKAAFWLLNSGLILRFITEPFLPRFQGNTLLVIIVILSVLLQIAAFAAYVAEIWPRLRPKKRRV